MCMFFFANFSLLFQVKPYVFSKASFSLFSFRCAFLTTAFVDSSLYYFHFAILAFILFSAHFLQHGSLLRCFHFVVLVFLLFRTHFTHLLLSTLHCVLFISLLLVSFCSMHISHISYYMLCVSFFSFHCFHIIIVFICWFFLHLVALVFNAHFFHALFPMFFVSTIALFCLYFVRISFNIFVLFNAHFIHELIQGFCCFKKISLFLHHFLYSTTHWFFLILLALFSRCISSMHYFFCSLFQ